jgi:NAD(P)-dependent dehydrogenase (short-subunit alcohol dehydrogenase family)
MEATGTAVVTGASRGIGRAVAIELARRGFDVVATMRNPAAGATLADEVGADAKGTLTVSRLDVTDPDTIVFPDSLKVLVNNAATEAAHPAFEDTPLELWRAMFETNVFGLIEATKRALPILRANGGGVICNVTSSSILAPMPFYGPYRGSKAVVSCIGESLQAEVKPFGIRVVEIMPGPIDTDMLAEGGGLGRGIRIAGVRRPRPPGQRDARGCRRHEDVDRRRRERHRRRHPRRQGAAARGV